MWTEANARGVHICCFRVALHNLTIMHGAATYQILCLILASHAATDSNYRRILY